MPKKGSPKEDVWKYISYLMATRGTSMYDESVTQLDHALQSATIGLNEQASSNATTAAFLHNIGHLILDEHNSQPDL
eukprot:UN22044